MCGIVKTVTRVGVIGALATGGLVLLAGPERVAAAFTQARSAINTRIDERITDPVALRAQLRDLESQYPARIAQVRSDLAELQQHVAQLERERTVTGRVVELVSADVDTLQSLCARAEEARTETATLGDPRTVEIVFDGRRLSMDGAYAKVGELDATREAYTQRQSDIERDLGYLATQSERLTSLLARLESERAEFQSQLWQLDRQVDSIARNERMIQVLSRRQHAIDEQSRYRAASLDQLHARLADLRARQEAQLAGFAAQESRTSYEDRAKVDLDRRVRPGAGLRQTPPPAPRPIEIRPDDAGDHPGCESRRADEVARTGV